MLPNVVQPGFEPRRASSKHAMLPVTSLTKSLNIERKLFQKPNMEDIDKIIMEEVIRILEKQDMPMNMIIEKLRPVIQYTDQARVIN